MIPTHAPRCKELQVFLPPDTEGINVFCPGDPNSSVAEGGREGPSRADVNSWCTPDSNSKPISRMILSSHLSYELILNLLNPVCPFLFFLSGSCELTQPCWTFHLIDLFFVLFCLQSKIYLKRTGKVVPALVAGGGSKGGKTTPPSHLIDS